MPDYSLFDEKRFFQSGKRPKVFEIPINDRTRKIGIQICEDMWDDDYECKVSTLQKEMGAELIINISASPYHENKMFLDYDKKDQWGFPTITFDAEIKENERIMRKDMVQQAYDMLESAGFKNIRARDNRYALGLGIHEMGTARMGRDPKTSVLDGNNRLHHVKNVYVTDGACMTSAACVNPSITYMALTARAANHAVEELKKMNI